MKPTNKVAAVSGAQSIGAGIAKALGAEGASVVVNYASSLSGERVASEIARAGGRPSPCKRSNRREDSGGQKARST
jgi:3-oxoacyl-[acyl-carrier protein] reductase